MSIEVNSGYPDEQDNPWADYLAATTYDLLSEAAQSNIPRNSLTSGQVVNYEHHAGDSRCVDYVEVGRNQPGEIAPSKRHNAGMTYEAGTFSLEETESSPQLADGWDRITTIVDIDPSKGTTAGRRELYTYHRGVGRFVLDRSEQLTVDTQTSEAERILAFLKGKLEEQKLAHNP